MEIDDERFAKDLGHLLNCTVNEDILIKRMEHYFSPRPARLGDTDDQLKEMELMLSKLSEKLGGPPDSISTSGEESVAAAFDTYGEAAIQEMLSVFHRCRHATCVTHLFYIALGFAPEHPEIWIPPLKAETAHQMRSILDNRFWEKTETAYIRLASFWDRAGQLLDFVFFNIRQYERDGFPKVMDRIAVNYIPLYPQLEISQSWQMLRSYQNSEKPDGLKWLLRRRNLLVHSLYLRPTPCPSEPNPIFISTYNHLDASVRDKLKTGTPEQELGYLHAHLSAAASLFSEVIDLCQLGVDIKSETAHQ
jgi:hypothetical protein